MDPDAKLGYNDYKFESSAGYGTNGGFLAEKGRNVYNIAKKLREEQSGAHYYIGALHTIPLLYCASLIMLCLVPVMLTNDTDMLCLLITCCVCCWSVSNGLLPQVVKHTSISTTWDTTVSAL